MADERAGGPAVGRGPALHPVVTGQTPHCNRCGFEVRARAGGCKNPCPNCGTVYPLGDCSD